jgi:hypothetical protein
MQIVPQSNQIMPATLHEKLEMANVFVKSNLMPRGLDKPEKVVIALEMGHELGLPPLIAIMNIAVINNKPTLKADMMVALALRSGKIEDIRISFIGKEHENDADYGCRVTIKRKGIKTLFKATFTRRDAKVAGLDHKDNWQKYERRMLKHRAMAFCIRDSLPEIFAGIYLPDELENIEHGNNNNTIIMEPEEVIEEVDEISQPEVRTVSQQQLNALRELSSKLFSSGIMESYIYDKYNILKMELLSETLAGELILTLQNNPDKIHDWIEKTYQNAG